MPRSSSLFSAGAPPDAGMEGPLPAGEDPASPCGRDSPLPLLRTGDTCWRLAQADRFAVIIDAEDYFRFLEQALLRARRQVLMVAWDFDTRIKLQPDRRRQGVPRRLGPLLSWLVRTRPELHVHVLTWRFSIVHAALRGTAPLFLGPAGHRRLHYRLAADHPTGACHHQKIAVIDDALAFCGGIDVTCERWDTRAHLDYDHHRRTPGGFRYEPFHDVTTAVDGEAARALGDLARHRWRCATGQSLPVPSAGAAAGPTPAPPVWPEDLPAMLRDVQVGIARTQAAFGEAEEALEVERLWLTAIAAARRTIYVEAQYLASRVIGQALTRRLEEPDGPEIVIVLPVSANSWLEEKTMDAARDHILAGLRAADHGGRLGVYAPKTARGRRIYVHAKVLVVDDRLLRIGSSNINNRSMGFDSECDVAVETRTAAEAQAVLDLRDGLVAEHLGCSVETVRRRLAERGSLVAAIEALRIRPGRTLHPLAPPPTGAATALLVESELLDPERPRWPFQALIHRLDWSWLRHRRRRAARQRTG